jgi:glycosyltransferase involved in cell wall biosynthesis
MRILELRQSLRHGNLDRLIVGTAALLRARGMEADVLLLYNRSRAHLLGEDQATLPDIHPLVADAQSHGVTAWQQLDSSPLSPQLLLAILREIRQRKYDLLHTHDVKTNVLGVLAGRLAGIPVVATAHGYPRAIRRNDVYRLLDLRILRLCQQVICVSEGLRQELLAAGLNARRLTVVHNGISVTTVCRGAAAGAHDLRHDLGLRPGDVIAMAIGRLSTEKGHSYLLRACQVVAAQRPHLHLVIVGDGPLRASLEREAAHLGIGKRVFFLGFRADVPALMIQSELLVHPSLSEGLPNVILEAMALGLPVIATAAGGIPELIRDGETGLIVPAADVEALASAMLRLIDHPEAAHTLARQGHDSVVANFTVERMAEGLATVFAESARSSARLHRGGDLSC